MPQKLIIKHWILIPSDREVLFNLGVIHMQQGYSADGMNFLFALAVKSDPDYFEAHHNLCGRLSNALAITIRRKCILREALRIKPNDAALRHTAAKFCVRINL